MDAAVDVFGVVDLRSDALNGCMSNISLPYLVATEQNKTRAPSMAVKNIVEMKRDKTTNLRPVRTDS
jgi:hypothetical protein